MRWRQLGSVNFEQAWDCGVHARLLLLLRDAELVLEVVEVNILTSVHQRLQSVQSVSYTWEPVSVGYIKTVYLGFYNQYGQNPQ